MKKLFNIGLLLSCLFAINAQAGVIAVDNVEASSTWKRFDVANLVNGKGLIGEKHTRSRKGKWLSSKNDLASLVFDLGNTFDIAGTTIWNFGNNSKRNAKNIQVSSSVDGINFDLIGELMLSRAKGKVFAGETFSLDTVARYFRFDIESGYGARFVGLSEVQFEVDEAAVPEPASMFLMLLGLVGLVARSRQQKAQA